MKLFKNRMSNVYSILVIAVLLAPGFVLLKPVAEEKYVIDKKESLVVWKGSMQFNANAHTGYVYVSNGQFIVNNGKLTGGAVEIDMNTITDPVHGSDNELIRHIKSPDFFDVGKFPIATFTINRVVFVKEGNVNITGDLTIKGITHPVTFPAEVEIKDGIVNAEGILIIDRTNWDIRYGSGKFFAGLADETISDSIEFSIKVVARKK